MKKKKQKKKKQKKKQKKNVSIMKILRHSHYVCKTGFSLSWLTQRCAISVAIFNLLFSAVMLMSHSIFSNNKSHITL